MTDVRDDAPLTTSKHPHPANDAAQIGLKGTPDTLLARSVTINRPASELYAFWRDLSNLATFMDNVVRIDVIDEMTSHWTVKAPGGKTVEWDARITEERPGELLAWTTIGDADVASSGRVAFRDAGARGTIVTATLAYDTPAGLFGKVVAKLFQREPAIQARRDLRRFKQLMETGEVASNAMNRQQHEEEIA